MPTYPAFDAASAPHLDGIFAPVLDEWTDLPCEPIQGALPADLHGTYARNGPNPRFPPIGSYTYPLDGDGMVHWVRFEGGRARYTNRFVRTPTLAAEERAGRALWGGVMTPIAPGADEVGPELAARPFRDMPDISVVHHAGRWLALAEGDAPYALNDDGSTAGRWTFEGGLPEGLCAHPKIDPASGEMVVFRYGFEDPLLSWAVVGRDGRVSRPPSPIAIDAPRMIHDFAITAHHLVLFVAPLRFDFTSADVLSWQPERGLRVAVVRRDAAPAPVRWFETDACWVWHFVNAYEEGPADALRIVVDYAAWSQPGFGPRDAATAPPTGGLRRMRLDLARGTLSVEARDERLQEFPRIDERRTGRPYRYAWMAAKDPALPASGVWNALRRHDMTTGAVVERRTGALALGEPIHVPRAGADPADEAAGYVLVYAHDQGSFETRLLVLRAEDIAGEPVATLRMPRRVPFGLHGCWLAGVA